MISAVISGNIGTDATIGDANGTPVVNFSMASRRFEKGAETTDWVRVAFFGSRAEKLKGFLTKGSKVCVSGTLGQRTYQHNGQERTELTLRANEIELMGSKPSASSSEDKNFEPLPF